MKTRNIRVAVNSIASNKIRSVLTTLGIVFGVASVIAMLAIGNGAQQMIIEQLDIVGANNIIIKSVFEESKQKKKEEEQSSMEKKKFSPGLTLKDIDNIRVMSDNIKKLSPEITYDCYAVSKTKRKKSKLIGVNSDYFAIFNIKTSMGSLFSGTHNEMNKSVCVLGYKISKKLFPQSNPIGKRIRVGKLNLLVIGVLENIEGVSKGLNTMGINSYNDDIYMPVKTMLMRYNNRSLVKIDKYSEGGSEENYNQLDKIIIQVKESEKIGGDVTLFSEIIKRRHNGNIDFEVIVPEQLLQQQKKTNDLFNYLLGAIAGISLLVGGIGIMNIMLASVLERIKEIGLRLAVGAKKKDIKLQFIFEALGISLSGGIVGIILGVILSLSIEQFMEMPIKISAFSIILSFLISVVTGVTFGYIPASRAAEQDPVNSLRYE